MSTITLSPVTPRPSLLDRAARRAVLSRLGDLGDEILERIEVHDARFWRRVALGGGVGAAESYIRGEWTTGDLPGFLRFLAGNRDRMRDLDRRGSLFVAAARRLAHFGRRNSRAGSRRNIAEHYDLGNDLFQLFLDETMTYSSGIYPRAEATLREAQVTKLDRICKKLDLSPDDHVLEIGTGWGSFAIHAAGEYGCRVTTTTISEEQRALAARRVHEAGLDHLVSVLFSDYRDLEGRYDKLVSIEMVEAVGHRYLDDYFGKCSSLLEDDGEMIIQAIVMPEQDYDRYLKTPDFIRTHVFPGSNLPSLGTIAKSLGRATDLRIVDVEDIAPHYARTLAEWRERFLARRDEVRALGYPDRFVRMWDFYLAYCEAGFAERSIGDLQIRMEKPSVRRGEV